MKYTVFSIDDSRGGFIADIQRQMNSLKWTRFDRVHIECVDGRTARLEELLEKEGLTESVGKSEHRFKVGQLGIWLTVINALRWVVENDEELVTFEDDARIFGRFEEHFRDRLTRLPADYDFFSLFVPRDHTDWFRYKKKLGPNGKIIEPRAESTRGKTYDVDGTICRTWQRYGGVSMLYSPAGAKRILDLIKEYGLMSQQYDEFLYCQERMGNLRGFTSNPGKTDLVRIRSARSLVQESEFYDS